MNITGRVISVRLLESVGKFPENLYAFLVDAYVEKLILVSPSVIRNIQEEY